MTIDYDTPRRTDVGEATDEPVRLLTAVKTGAADVLDLDDLDVSDIYKVPDGDLSGEELMVRVIPQQADEFVCSSCFLVHHRSNLAQSVNDRAICHDCV